MKKRVFYMTLIGFCIILSNCNNNKPSSGTVAYSSNYQKKNLDNLLSMVKKSFPTGLDFSEGLLSNAAFKEIFEHSENYLGDVVSFLRKGKVDNDDAGYCIYAMQSLDVHSYARLCNTYLTLFDEKKISENLLHLAITPNFLGKRIIVDNYTNPEVIKVLASYRNNKNISDNFKKTLKDISEGSYTTR